MGGSRQWHGGRCWLAWVVVVVLRHGVEHAMMKRGVQPVVDAEGKGGTPAWVCWRRSQEGLAAAAGGGLEKEKKKKKKRLRLNRIRFFD